MNQDPIGWWGGENFYVFALNTQVWIDILGLSCECKKCVQNAENYTKKKEAIESQVREHEYLQPERAGSPPPKIPGGVSGAILHTKITGEKVGGSDHVKKGQSILKRLKKNY